MLQRFLSFKAQKLEEASYRESSLFADGWGTPSRPAGSRDAQEPDARQWVAWDEVSFAASGSLLSSSTAHECPGANGTAIAARCPSCRCAAAAASRRASALPLPRLPAGPGVPADGRAGAQGADGDQ